MVSIRQQVIERILDADRQGAVGLIMDWARDHGRRQAVIEVLEPALVELGELWSGEAPMTLAHGYLAAKVAEDVLSAAREDEFGPADNLTKGPVVIGNIEDDYHALGRKMVCVFLRAAGWQVVDLGNDVPAETFVDKAVEVGARVVGASAMMHTTAENILRLREQIDARGLRGRLQMAVGGAIFNLRPSLVDEVGGDGTAYNALAVPGLMDRLWAGALAEEGVV